MLDPAVFLHAMQQWTECTQRRAYANASCRLFASRTGEHYVLNLLAELGLRPRGVPGSPRSSGSALTSPSRMMVPRVF
jgi:hypothetical protein